MCIYMCVCVRVCIYIYIYIYIIIYIYIEREREREYVHTYIYLHLHTCLHLAREGVRHAQVADAQAAEPQRQPLGGTTCLTLLV